MLCRMTRVGDDLDRLEEHLTARQNTEAFRCDS